MSRPRTSTAILEARGSFVHNPGRKAARANEPRPTGELGRPPKHLADDEKKIWRELARIAPPGVLTNSDRWLVEMAVRLMTRVRKGTARTMEFGQLAQCLARMGLSPADRSRVSAVPQPTEEDSVWDRFMEE
jgi:phage terminase small subunit